MTFKFTLESDSVLYCGLYIEDKIIREKLVHGVGEITGTSIQSAIKDALDSFPQSWDSPSPEETNVSYAVGCDLPTTPTFSPEIRRFLAGCIESELKDVTQNINCPHARYIEALGEVCLQRNIPISHMGKSFPFPCPDCPYRTRSVWEEQLRTARDFFRESR